ncbi:Thioredoxin- transmembrane protein 2 [Basidiobolus ranarum]|uniref:Thioredoxin- transmembrane protein 2 n=1 Tax=Basidiobolus ranarum TaxID=34480 RepID=A0ABR2WVM2_9FUNG
MSELAQRLFRVHYLSNLLLSSLPFIVRFTPTLCQRFLFADPDQVQATIEQRIYLGISFFILLKFRKTGSAEEFLSVTFLYAKVGGLLLLYFYGAWKLILFYLGVWTALFVFCPQPSYQGPSNVKELTNAELAQEIENTLKEDGNELAWVLLLAVSWSPKCQYFEVPYAKLSLAYGSDTLKFGKIDVEKYPEVAATYDVSTSSTTLELPTVVLIRNGKEYARLPSRSEGKTFSLWEHSEQSVIDEFQLDQLSYDLKPKSQ